MPLSLASCFAAVSAPRHWIARPADGPAACTRQRGRGSAPYGACEGLATCSDRRVVVCSLPAAVIDRMLQEAEEQLDPSTVDFTAEIEDAAQVWVSLELALEADGLCLAAASWLL
jgi:hypothetical protein